MSHKTALEELESIGGVSGEEQDPGNPAAPIGMTHSALRDQAAVQLRSAILEGRYKPGERLVEDRLAQTFGISRNPVREALRMLAAEGLVDIRPRRGAAVATMSHATACELIEVRATLEGFNARLAARRRDANLTAAIAKVLEEGHGAMAQGRAGEFARCNARVHDVLAEAGNNAVLGEMLRSLRERSSAMYVPLTDEQAKRSWQEHEAILQQVVAGDEQMAELLASRHVFQSGANYLRANECGACVRGFADERRPSWCPHQRRDRRDAGFSAE